MEEQKITVTIAGRTLTLTGGEDAAYLQQVAEYVNRKCEEAEQSEGYRRLPAEERKLMILLNMADDVMQQQKSAEEMRQKMEQMEAEMDTLRQDLVHARMNSYKEKGHRGNRR